MAILPTLLANGDGVVGPREWSSVAQSFTAVDEGIAAADGISISTANNVTQTTSFQLTNTPTDFQSMTTLSWQFRQRQTGRVDDNYVLAVRIMSGTTVLAAADSGGTFANIATVTNTAYQNTTVTAFAYVNTGASKTLWDAAEVEIRATFTQNMGPDGMTVQVDTFQFTGTYEPAVAATDVTPDSAAHAQVATEPTIEQIFGVTPDAATHGQVATEPSVVQTHELTPDATAHGQVATEPTLSVIFNVTPDSATHAQVATESAITPIFVVTPDSATHAQVATEPSVVQTHELTPDAAAHAQVATEPTLDSETTVAPEAATHTQVATEPSVVQTHNLTPDSTSHGQVATSPSVAPPSAVREFTSSDDLRTAIGALDAMTYGTVAILLKRNSTAQWRTILAPHDSGGAGRIQVSLHGDGIGWWSGSSAVNGGAFTTNQVWHFLLIRKATGSSGPRVSAFNKDTQQWVHGSIGAIGDGTGAGAGGTIRFDYEGFSEKFIGRVAVRAAWSNALPWAADTDGDAAIEAAGLHTSLQAWVDANPDAGWRFDQASVTDPVLDWTGGGADETSRTGTAVITDDSPPDFDWTLSGGAVEITPASAVHSQVATEPALSQIHVITPDSTIHAQVATEPSIAQTHELTPDAAVHSQVATQPSLVSDGSIVPADAVHEQTATEPTLAQTHELAPNPATHAQSAAEPTLAQTHELTPNPANHGQIASEPNLITSGTIAPDAAIHAQSATEPTLEQIGQIVPEPSHHGQVADQPAIQQQHNLTVNAANHGQIATEPSLTQLHILTVNSAGHVQIASEPNLSQGSVIQPAAATHAQTATSPTLTQNYNLTVDATVHAQVATEPTLVQLHFLQPDAAIHAQLASQPVIFVVGSDIKAFYIEDGLVKPAEILGVIIEGEIKQVVAERVI